MNSLDFLPEDVRHAVALASAWHSGELAERRVDDEMAAVAACRPSPCDGLQGNDLLRGRRDEARIASRRAHVPAPDHAGRRSSGLCFALDRILETSGG